MTTFTQHRLPVRRDNVRRALIRARVQLLLRWLSRSPTRSPVRSLSRWLTLPLVCGLAVSAAGWPERAAVAHPADGLAPADPGLAVGLSAAGGWWRADEPLPAVRLPGVTGTGERPEDGRGWALEHATVGAGLRWTRNVAASVAVGWHGDGEHHVETAWLQLDLDDPLARTGDEGDRFADSDQRSVTLGAGRHRVPIGATLERAGHFDRYSQMPLAKRAAFNGDWIEDGLNLRWTPHAGDGRPGLRWLEAIDLGLWRARRFPGGHDGPMAPLLHARVRLGSLAVDGFFTRMKPDGRGSFVGRDDAGHTHSAPRCDSALDEVACFGGRVDLFGASANWTTPIRGVTVDVAALVRRERGELFSGNGSTRYRGRSQGGWVDLTWAPLERWEAGLRHEWLRASNAVAGIGATRVAADAGILPYRPSRRTVAMVGFRAHRDWRVGIEAGRESIGERGSSLVALRLAWLPSPWTLASW